MKNISYSTLVAIPYANEQSSKGLPKSFLPQYYCGNYGLESEDEQSIITTNNVVCAPFKIYYLPLNTFVLFYTKNIIENPDLLDDFPDLLNRNEVYVFRVDTGNLSLIKLNDLGIYVNDKIIAIQ
ncbi:hypothetical protein [uncultured Microscilla sp.]|uniref:hypothetical protein n=1 Tax=uncultured Microscilla sp. TaxID=432653 RepID=UPI002623A352|nr:hypothetical protein [uncultured Microscilla sp.]